MVDEIVDQILNDPEIAIAILKVQTRRATFRVNSSKPLGEWRQPCTSKVNERPCVQRKQK